MHSPRFASEFSSRSLPYAHIYPHYFNHHGFTRKVLDSAVAVWLIVPPPLTTCEGLTSMEASLSTSTSPKSGPVMSTLSLPMLRNTSRSPLSPLSLSSLSKSSQSSPSSLPSPSRSQRIKNPLSLSSLLKTVSPPNPATMGAA